VDLSVDALEDAEIVWAEAAAFSVPMHTAARIALSACRAVRRVRPDLPLCLYGLYAALARDCDEELVDTAIAGEYEEPLSNWVEGLAHSLGSAAGGGPETGGHQRARTLVELGRGRFGLPARRLLPPLERYATLYAFGEVRLVGYVEASHGCAHRCRHCPVPVVYDGRTRVVSVDSVVADVAQLVGMGARHITFGDPDFLNGPRHALRVVSAVHEAFPELTFDVTAKVEHVLAHQEIWPVLAASGCIFVVSAFESTSPTVLRHLAKGHCAGDEREAVALLRANGIEPRPSFLPFTPWTTAADLVDLLDLVTSCDLVGNVDPVQFSIRLLVPPGSLLLRSGALESLLGPYDSEHLSWTWHSSDTRLDELCARLAAIAQRIGAESWPAKDAFRAVRFEVLGALGYNLSMQSPQVDARCRSHLAEDERPKLSEPWFCCAEPTSAQLDAATLEPPAQVPVP
jgi:Radical SAM superfamily